MKRHNLFAKSYKSVKYCYKIGLLKSLQLIINFILSPLLRRLLTSAIHNNGILRIINNTCNLWPVHRIAANTIYVFVFLGEFGYEIFNWQGVIRKFAGQLPLSSQVVIAGRRGLTSFYDFAAQYIDISDFEPYKNSIAASYFALPPNMASRKFPPDTKELQFDAFLRKQLKEYILPFITDHTKVVEFVFSSSLTAFPKCVFGVDRRFYVFKTHYGRIYNQFDFLISNNTYTRIVADRSIMNIVAAELGFSLNKPYILIQGRHRNIGPQYGKLDYQIKGFIQMLAQYMPVVLLSFKTGRYLDSSSEFQVDYNNCFSYIATSFYEQSILIDSAYKCVFFTDGDLGSHTYLPPFMGKDVFVIAPESIFSQHSSPINEWNKYIFHFGGRMIPYAIESILVSHENIIKTCQLITERYAGA